MPTWRNSLAVCLNLATTWRLCGWRKVFSMTLWEAYRGDFTLFWLLSGDALPTTGRANRGLGWNCGRTSPLPPISLGAPPSSFTVGAEFGRLSRGEGTGVVFLFGNVTLECWVLSKVYNWQLYVRIHKCWQCKERKCGWNRNCVYRLAECKVLQINFVRSPSGYHQPSAFACFDKLASA